jgi:hypothetical protein
MQKHNVHCKGKEEEEQPTLAWPAAFEKSMRSTKQTPTHRNHLEREVLRNDCREKQKKKEGERGRERERESRRRASWSPGQMPGKPMLRSYKSHHTAHHFQNTERRKES